MVIPLSEERQQIVRSLVQDGRFASEHEVIGESLRRLQEHDEQTRLAELLREIAIGIESVERGKRVSFDPRATLERIRSRQTSTAGPS